MLHYLKCNPYDSARVIEAFNPHLDGEGFVDGRAIVMAAELPFYPGYSVYDLSDSSQVPPFRKYVIANAALDDIVPLDWTNAPIYALNDRVPIAIKEYHCADYIRFFFDFVSDRQGAFRVIESTQDIPWTEDPPLQARRAVEDVLCVLQKIDDAPDGYLFMGCFLHKQSLFRTQIHVQHNGIISLMGQELLVDDMPVEDVFTA